MSVWNTFDRLERQICNLKSPNSETQRKVFTQVRLFALQLTELQPTIIFPQEMRDQDKLLQTQLFHAEQPADTAVFVSSKA